VAVAVAAACMVGLSAQAVIDRASCSNDPILANVAANDDIAAAVQTIARAFNKGDHTADGRCVQVQVTAADSATVASQLQGGANTAGLSGVNAWIPDSRLWINEARFKAQGAQAVLSSNITVAMSPVMIVTTRAVTGRFDEPLGWNDLLPSGFGGPPASLGITVDLPDPTESGVGLTAIVELSRELSRDYRNAADASEAFEAFAHDSETTVDTDSAGELASWLATSNAASGGRAVTVASEQAVLQYDESHQTDPLVARYPSGPSSALGTPELDYPYVLISGSPAEVQAARAFGKYLQTPYAQSVVRYYGFRSANGVPDKLPQSAGLSSQPLQTASAFGAVDATHTLATWQTLSRGARDLVLFDVSPATGAPDGNGAQTIEQEISATAQGGLAEFPSSWHVGTWLMGQSKSASQPYKQVIGVGGLMTDVGLMSRKQQGIDIIKGLTTSNGNLMLYDVILTAYKYMTSTYAPNDINTILVLTAGVDGAHDMPLAQLLTKLKGLYNPDRKVEVVPLMFGHNGNFKALQQIAKATGGTAFEVARPSEIGKIFIDGVAHVLCNQGCAGL
jgi:Bacterial extracellular solute-binding protein